MLPTIRCSICTAVFFSLTLATFNAQCQEDTSPTAVEIARLPKFCWGPLNVPDARGPEFNISDCGPGMNHYCQGLVDLIRAKSAPKKGTRMMWLGRADGNVRYTEIAMKDYPKCALRDHVAASRADVNNLLVVFGGKRPKAP